MPSTRLPIALCFVAAAIASSAGAEPPRDLLHAQGTQVWETPDERGMTLLRETRRRSPSGLLYPYPQALPAWADFGLGWRVRGGLEAGAFFDGGDEDETRFETYAERTDEAFLSLLDLELWNASRGDWAALRGGSVGRDDQFYSVEGGRVGWLRLRGSFSGVPHRYASDAAILFDGAGGSRLTLPAPLVPAGSSVADVTAALATRAESEVEVQRDRTQTEARLRLLPALALVGRYRLEARHGEIPSGVGIAFPDFSSSAGGTLELPSPVNDRTHVLDLGLEYAAPSWQANLGYDGSFYRNRERSLVVENPFEAPGLAPIERSRFALAPDNDWHRLRAELAAALPLRSRATATVSWATSRQDEDLLPPTVSSEVIGSTDLAAWSSSAALASNRADAKIEDVLFDVDWSANPWRPLRLRAGLRWDDRRNRTDYTAFNPQTAEFGYIVEDGGHGSLLGEEFVGIYRPGVAGSSWRFRSMPFGRTRRTWELGASYAAPLRSTLDVRWQHEETDRDVSERPNTRERRLRASLGSRGLVSWATTRLGYEYRTRDGGRIDYGVYSQYFSESLPGFVSTYPDGEPPHNLQQLVRPALADVRGQRWSELVNLLLGERTDLVLSAVLRSNDYAPDFGLRRERSGGLEAEGSVQVSPALSAHAFAGFERSERELASIRGIAASTDGSAGGPTFPLTNAWSVGSDGSTLGWGGGMSLRLLRSLRLVTDYRFLVTREDLDTDFASLMALARPDFGAPVPSRLPRLRARDHTVETSLIWALRPDLSARLYCRYDRSAVDDFHQRRLPVVVEHRVFFGHEALDFEAMFYGVAIQLRLPGEPGPQEEGSP